MYNKLINVLKCSDPNDIYNRLNKCICDEIFDIIDNLEYNYSDDTTEIKLYVEAIEQFYNNLIYLDNDVCFKCVDKIATLLDKLFLSVHPLIIKDLLNISKDNLVIIVIALQLNKNKKFYCKICSEESVMVKLSKISEFYKFEYLFYNSFDYDCIDDNYTIDDIDDIDDNNDKVLI